MSQTGSVVLCGDLGIGRWPLIFVECGEGSAILAWETVSLQYCFLMVFN